MTAALPVLSRRSQPMRRLALVVLFAGVISQAVGCHNLQEHRRARWNYGPGMSADSDPYAGVTDLADVAPLV
ncbi:hypothetical protein [Alienimonas chondri]|uniref:Uncharacterized protein n=1 Tax=Alienimonas chondri TaxID=2681879 RepID=A0ABX1VK42_9PLAN|nr:hypothetical protein [Alienimonas chondri]NNJ28084.1 hypothetical protein [Alienimonas chondri]